MNLIYQLDNKILPGDDLYHHVNNNWLHKNPLPPSESRWGTFSELREKSFKDLKKIIEELKNEGPKNSKQQKIIEILNKNLRKKLHLHTLFFSFYLYG